MIDQDPPHRLRGDGEEAISIGGGQLALAQEPKIHLMNEGGGREGVVWRLSPELSPGHMTSSSSERHELFERIAIACAPPRKTLGDLAGSHDVNRVGERPHHIVSAGGQPPSLDPLGSAAVLNATGDQEIRRSRDQEIKRNWVLPISCPSC